MVICLPYNVHILYWTILFSVVIRTTKHFYLNLSKSSVNYCMQWNWYYSTTCLWQTPVFSISLFIIERFSFLVISQFSVKINHKIQTVTLFNHICALPYQTTMCFLKIHHTVQSVCFNHWDLVWHMDKCIGCVSWTMLYSPYKPCFTVPYN